MRTTSLLNAILAVTLFSAITVSVARGQTPLENTPIPMWVPDGAVTDVVKVGNTLVVGGRFEYVGPPTGPFAIVDAADAASLNTGATFIGSATRIVPDGSGGWLVVVDACACGAAGALEHVSAAGIRDPQFVLASGISAVRDLAVEAGRLFVAGFTPQGQERLVALDPATGALLPWTPAVQPRDISGLVAAGGVVYVNYARHSGLSNSLALDAATGAVVPFPALQDAEVIAATADRVYLVTPSPASKALSAYTANGQRVPGFPDILYASLESVVASPTLVFVSGTLPGTTAYATQVVALDASTATPVWSSPVFSYLDVNFRDGGIGTLAIDGTTLYVGGAFTRIGGVPRTRLAAFDATSGALLPWAPSVGGRSVSAVAPSAGRVAIGGFFRSVGGITRRGLVSLDLTTGRPTAVQPADSSWVTALAVSGDLVVAATASAPLNAAPEVYAYSAATGARFPRALTLNGEVNSMAIHGTTLFMGGAFSGVDGQARRNLAAYDLVAGQMRSWNPSPDNFVRKLKVHAGGLYAVGPFDSLTGYGRNGAVSFDLTTLEVTGWNPQHGGTHVNDLDAWQDRIFLGVHVRDEFHQLPPFSVVKTLAVDRSSGTTLNIDLPIGTDIAQVGGTLVVGGNGRNVTNLEALPLATFDGATGQSLPWTPNVFGSGFSDTLIGLDGYLAVMSSVSVGGRPLAGLAVFKPRLVLPGPPRQIQMTVTGSTVSLAWSPGAAPAPLGYLLEAGSAPGLSDLGRFAFGSATQVAAAVAPGSYALRVRAIGGSGEGPASSEWLFTTPSTSTPPAAPSVLVGSVAGNVVSLGWNAATGNATTYVLEGGTAPGLSNLGVLPLGSLDTSIVGAVPPGTYYFRVRAANASGASAPSNEVVVVVP